MYMLRCAMEGHQSATIQFDTVVEVKTLSHVEFTTQLRIEWKSPMRFKFVTQELGTKGPLVDEGTNMGSTTTNNKQVRAY